MPVGESGVEASSEAGFSPLSSAIHPSRREAIPVMLNAIA